jgi:hypothetical protein
VPGASWTPACGRSDRRPAAPGNDSHALIPLDQPAAPAQLIADFTPPHRAAPRGPRRASQPCPPASKPGGSLGMALGRFYLPHICQPADAPQVGQI